MWKTSPIGLFKMPINFIRGPTFKVENFHLQNSFLSERKNSRFMIATRSPEIL